MKKSLRYFINFVLLSLILAAQSTSCSRQIKGHATAPDTLQRAAPIVVQQQYRDPLFFIEGQLCQHLRKIFQDSKGNLWFGTNVYDLMKYDGDTLIYITDKEAFSGGRVTGIAEDRDGNLWFSTAHGLSKYDGKSFVTFTEKEGLLNAEIWSLIIDSKGIFWIGQNEGLSRFDGQAFRNIPIPKPQVKEPNTIYSANRITGIAEDKAGNLWLGTDGFGICKYDGQSFTHFTTEQGLADNTISELMIDTRGRLWIGTYWGGLSMFDGEKFTNFTREGVISGEEVGAFFEDSNGDIWFGVENNGVYKYDGDTFTHFYQESGLNGSILSIYKDREGRFWFGGWGGLFRFDGQSFVSVTKDGPWN